MSQQGLRQASFRDYTGDTAGSYNGNLIAASEQLTGVTGRHANEAEILMLQSLLSSTNTDLNGLRAEYAALVGASNWSGVGTITFPTQTFTDPEVDSSVSGQSLAVPLSWVVEATPGADLSGTQFLVHLSDGTGDNRVLLYSNGGDLRMQARESAANVADFSIGTLSTNTPFRCAVRWASGDFGGSLDGATAVTAGGSFSETTYTVYHFGSSTGGTVQWGGSIELVQEYDDIAFADAQLEAFSA